MRRLVVCLCFLIFSSTVVAPPASGQSRDTASIYGVVQDNQGAVISGARVTVTSPATQQTRTVTTSSDGGFLFPLLPVGSYDTRVDMQGFQSHVSTGILIQANENVRLDIQLQVGNVQETITVNADAIQVESRSATLKSTVDQRRIVELPLNGRNPADLALLTPGVVSGAGNNVGDTYGRDKRPRGTKQLTVNGSRDNNLRFTLDGGENMDPLTNYNSPFPFPDAVQEFSVQTASTGVELGNSSGGSLNVVTKSGTNEIHGSGFWFLRNTALNARNFFSNQQDTLKRNQAGFTLGGPIIKNKLFAFGGYQQTWMRSASGASRVQTLTAAERTGDFSGISVPIHDPLTREPFPGNKIPQSRFSPAAVNLLTVSPTPGADGFLRYSVANPENYKQYIGRVDYLLNDKNTIAFRYFQDDQETPFKLQDPNNIHASMASGFQKTQNVTLSHNYVVSPTMLVHTQITGTHLQAVTSSVFPKTITDFGINVRPTGPQISVGLNDTGVSFNSPHDGKFGRASEEILHDWNWTKGKHTWVWGFQLGWRQYNENITWGSAGQFSFDGRATSAGSQNGYDRADFLLGYLSGYSQNSGESENRRQITRGLYVSDSWRLNRRLTLTFGLRYEPARFYSDTKDRLQTFDRASYLNGTRTSIYHNAPAGLFFPGDQRPDGGTFSKNLLKSDNNNFAPRIGIAWDPTGSGRTSVRAGYGLYYDALPLWATNNYNNITPFSYSVDFPNGILDNPFLGRESQNRFPLTSFSPDSPYPSPLDLLVLDGKYVSAYSQNWHLTVEREILRGTLLRVGYVGSKGTNLVGEYDQNAPIYNPNLSLAANRADINGRRSLSDFQGIGRMFFGLNSIYNSMQVSLDKRYSNGFTVQATYTWSKTIDYHSTQQYGGGLAVANPFRFFASRGPATQDRAHRVVTSFVWDLPEVSDAVGPVVKTVLKDWRASGIFTAQSGAPFTVNSSGDPVAGAGRARADLIGTQNPVLPSDRSKGERIAAYFDTSLFANASPNTYGTLARNALRGPGYANVDFSLVRSFRIRPFGEAGRGEFRAEAFNLFNATHLAMPNTGIQNSTFGTITRTDGDARILQLAIRVMF